MRLESPMTMLETFADLPIDSEPAYVMMNETLVKMHQ